MEAIFVSVYFSKQIFGARLLKQLECHGPLLSWCIRWPSGGPVGYLLVSALLYASGGSLVLLEV